MTNEQIKKNYLELLIEGGHIEIAEASAIFLYGLLSYNQWLSIGYQVKKGEHAFCKLDLWHPRKNKKASQEIKDNEEIDEHDGTFYKHCDYLFTFRQVEKIA